MTLLINFVKLLKTPFFSIFCTVLLNLSRITIIEIIYVYNLGRTSQCRPTQYVSIMQANLLMLFTGENLFIVKVTGKKETNFLCMMKSFLIP